VTGTYWLCVYAYSPFSGILKIEEAKFENGYDFEENVV